MRKSLLIAATAAALPFSALAGQAAPPAPVPAIDIDRYSGLWHEMARYPSPLQPGACYNPTAEYGYDDDANLAIVNTCSTLSGEIVSTTLATGVQTSRDGAAAFTVDYGDGMVDDYWVVAIADDYSWSIVSVPERDRLWILTREPVTGGPQMQALVAKARDLGFDTSKLIYSQKGGLDLTSSAAPRDPARSS